MSTARRILIVDDDEDLRGSLEDQLALHDEFEITTAGTAASGIECAKAEHFDLVLFDVNLPDMDGQRYRRRPSAGPRCRRQRLHHQAVQVCRAAGPHPRAAPPA